MSAEVSVVVATRNRARRLDALMQSLAAQEAQEFELIVVDDGSNDDTGEVLARVRADWHPGLRVVRLEGGGSGPAVARNAGWPQATAPLVAFVDDDCVVDPRWIGELLTVHRDEPGALIQGRTQANPSELDRLSAFSRTVTVERLGPWFETCNIAYPRGLLESLDGFDPALADVDDTDLAMRAQKSGAGALFAPQALAYHAVRVPGALGLAREAKRWGAIAALAKRHPEIRREFASSVFWQVSHQRLALALAGVLLARRTRGVSLAVAVPYVLWHRPNHNSTVGTFASLPAHALVDSAEVVALLRGSASAGSLVV